jgi:hypothetical protein
VTTGILAFDFEFANNRPVCVYAYTPLHTVVEQGLDADKFLKNLKIEGVNKRLSR